MNGIVRSAFIGFALGCVVIFIWWYWALVVFRWNSDRLGDLILIKYQATKYPDDQHFYGHANVTVSPRDNIKYCTADMQLKNKETQAIISSETVTYKITDDCKKIDLDCIRV